MSGFLRLHNKFHRSSHHTLSSKNIQDQGIDPIASKDEPFNGIFYNLLTDELGTFKIPTNSYDWYSNYTTVKTFSANWDSIGTTYTTVNANSANWSSGYSAYNTLCAVSGNYDSVYTTVCANSSFWANEYVLYTNRAQENTRSKTFSGYNLKINPDNTVDWDLDIAQVAYLSLDRNVILKNPPPSTMKNGGLYNLYVVQGEPSGGYSLTFESDYIFPIGVNISTDMNFALSGVTIFSFFCDSVFMYGEFYKTNLKESGQGIVRFVTNRQMTRFSSGDEIFPFTGSEMLTMVDNIAIMQMYGDGISLLQPTTESEMVSIFEQDAIVQIDGDAISLIL